MALEIESTPTPSSTSSAFLPTVCLHSWWLVKAERDFHGKLLAVAGYTSRQQDAKRVFVSAPIIKRHDLSTLETADGIYVIIIGFINELHTNENGFPSEVFNHFLFGFPPDWECCVVNFFKEVATGIDSGNIITSNEEEPKSPVTPIQSQGETNELSEHFAGGSASRKSRTLPGNTEDQCSAEKVVLGRTRPEMINSVRKKTKSKTADPKGKMKSIAADTTRGSLSVRRSNRRINFDSHEKLSAVSPDLSNFRRSRSGRLLLPPLEFWRNQMPVYDADHSLTEILDGASFLSPCSGSGAQSQKKQRK
ncbi:kinetochore-associated protein KNL-2 homolog [Prosopis cineraria]|uniref:kinetochore-associated protein KNL-2 homolog n=1 Tax=Prosopis cineraria TaxID=364024 RepID=UPI00240F77C0|nr:kinetochore-associated protein KNL-2 homolog [Prosopis cineraria]XP_054800236.1 kinetochore-associated protein KNL-2 homolog [Prosopis cineraria]XP_054800243.1 kinetochore-associated protein KNL-2 homolog [Prosopis cineraria]XP_054800250.1 kinetochore-associated protein KNL-2 homolog [Prosopis cineraria]